MITGSVARGQSALLPMMTYSEKAFVALDAAAYNAGHVELLRKSLGGVRKRPILVAALFEGGVVLSPDGEVGHVALLAFEFGH